MADGGGAVLLTFGTRPEAVKMAPVVRALNTSPTLRPVVCLTGQHGEMVGQILPIFEVRPDFNLSIMAENQTPSQVAAAVYTELPRVLAEVRPEILLVQGDTTTAMAAAVAGHYAKLPVGHVEAGLRTGNLFHPFPEEANRKIISAVSTLHFAPTESAAANLRAEAIPEHDIHVTGNTVVDALHFLLDRQEAVAMPERRLILVTAHRRENFGEPLERICRAVRTIVRLHHDIEVLYPVHPNPNVRGTVYSILDGEPRVHLTEPLDYIEFIRTLSRCRIVLSDSGGVQEEAPVLGKPVLVLREFTERPEAVEAGTAELVGTDEKRIVDRTGALLDDPREYEKMSRMSSPFGDGHAGERIVRALETFVAGSELTRNSELLYS